MAATALLKFTQATVGTGGNGIALSGVLGQLVTVSNSDNTDVLSWQIDLVYSESGTVVPATPFAFSDNGSAPTATFTPDVRRSFRFVLKVWSVLNRVGTPDIDIRNFSIPEQNGIIIPPVQIWPLPLPDPASGDPDAKPNEMNFGGQAGGWAGTGNDGLLNNTLTKLLVKSLRERWVDGNTTVAFAKQNGSRHTPYQTISQALNDVQTQGSTDSKWVIYVATASYNETLTVPAQRSVTLVGEDYATTSINMTSGDTIAWSIAGSCYLSLRNIRAFKVSAVEPSGISPDTGTLYLNDASLEVLEGLTRPIDFVGVGPNTHITDAVTTGRYAVDGVDYVSQVTCGYFAAYDTLIMGNTLHINGDATIVSCQLDPGAVLSLDSYSPTLYVDAMTQHWLEASSVNIPNQHPVVLMDPAYTYPGKELTGTTYTAGKGDIHKTLWTLNTSDVVVTFRNDADDPTVPVGAVIYFKQENVGWISFATGGGVAVSSRTTRTTAGIGAVVRAVKIRPNEWALSGDLLDGAAPYTFDAEENEISRTNLNRLNMVDFATTATVVLPTQTQLPLPDNTKIEFVQANTGQVVFEGAVGVTINTARTLKLRAQWSNGTLTKLFGNTWLLTGDLEA